MTKPSARDRAYDIKESDDSNRPAADLRGQSAIDQIGWQMDSDELELESARKIAEYKKDIRAV